MGTVEDRSSDCANPARAHQPLTLPEEYDLDPAELQPCPASGSFAQRCAVTSERAAVASKFTDEPTRRVRRGGKKAGSSANGGSG